MAKALNDAEIWLPYNKNNNNVVLKEADVDVSLGFPTEFPYEFGDSAWALSSPVESVAGSTETDSSNSSSEFDEDFFAALASRLSQTSLHETPKLCVPTHRDQTEVMKGYGLVGSPQSTLSGIGSPSVGSQVPSPPTTPFPSKNDLAWDVLYAAAGHVARMKMAADHAAFLGAPRTTQAPPTQTPSLYSNLSYLQAQLQWQRQQQQSENVWGRQAKANWMVQQNRVVRNIGNVGAKCGRPVSLSSHSTWAPLQAQAQYSGSGMRTAVDGGRSGGRRTCGGTGVFLPRQYGNSNPPETRKKTNCAPVMLPSRVVYGRNIKNDDLNAVNQSGFSAAFATEYDVLMARRNALLMQQQRLSVRAEEAVNRDVSLPQDWIY